MAVRQPSSITVTFDESVVPDDTKSKITLKLGSADVQGSMSYESASGGSGRW